MSVIVRMPSKFVSYTVTPGKACKVSLPPCSALEIKNAALIGDEPLTGRSTLECDLATHRFVLCSLPPGGGRLQASLSTVVTNDPDQTAWLFLNATGARAFHVLGQMRVDDGGSQSRPSHSAQDKDLTSSAVAGESDEDDWPSAADVQASKPASSSSRKRAISGAPATEDDDADDNSETIEVLLPDGDGDVEYGLSEASDESDDFVRWMVERTSDAPASQPPKRKQAEGTQAAKNPAATPTGAGHSESRAPNSGGSRSQRRRAATKRARDVQQQ